jgi:hypothetical protein
MPHPADLSVAETVLNQGSEAEACVEKDYNSQAKKLTGT